MAGRHPVAGVERQFGLERNIIDECSVLAAQILHGPVFPVRFEREVLAGKPPIFRKTDLGSAGASYCQAPGEGDSLGLAVGTLNEKLAGPRTINCRTSLTPVSSMD